MKLEHVKIATLTPDPKNARNHDRGIPELVASLQSFGQQKNVVVWRDVVIAGNGLVEAAKELGWQEITISRVPDDWTYEQSQAFALADNRTAELSSWDSSVLNEIRFELDSQGWDTEKFGFEPLRPAFFTDTDPDDVPDIPEIPKSRFGDLYQLGNHRLLCGDATDKTSYGSVLGRSAADLVFADPPYGISHSGKGITAKGVKGNDFGSIVGDDGIKTALDIRTNDLDVSEGSRHMVGSKLLPQRTSRRSWLDRVGQATRG